eukprot:4608543-Alexandrium_andersonii.AAC.1
MPTAAADIQEQNEKTFLFGYTVKYTRIAFEQLDGFGAFRNPSSCCLLVITAHPGHLLRAMKGSPA